MDNYDTLKDSHELAQEQQQDLDEANDAQLKIEHWCYDHLPEAFKDCLKRPAGESLLAHAREDKRDSWLSLLKLTGLYRAETEFAGETHVIAASGWCDCERVWEYINHADAKHAMLEEMLDA